MIDSAYHIIEEAGEYLEVSYNQTGGLFGSKKAGVEGKYFKTDRSELQHFLSTRKFHNKSKHTQCLSSFSGSWNEVIVSNEQKQVFDFSTACPSSFERQDIPLPSDSLWREDIAYRRLKDMKKSQEHKELL